MPDGTLQFYIGSKIKGPASQDFTLLFPLERMARGIMFVYDDEGVVKGKLRTKKTFVLN